MGLVTKANGSPDLADKMGPDIVVVTIVSCGMKAIAA